MKKVPLPSPIPLLAAVFAAFVMFAVNGGIEEANAVAISNCSGSTIAVTAIPSNAGQSGRSANARLNPGVSRNIMGSAPLVGVKVYEIDLVRTLRISAPQLDNNGTYSTIRMATGHWQLVQGKAC